MLLTEWKEIAGVPYADEMSKFLSTLLGSKTKKKFIRMLYAILFSTAEMLSRTVQELYPELDEYSMEWFYKIEKLIIEFHKSIKGY